MPAEPDVSFLLRGRVLAAAACVWLLVVGAAGAASQPPAPEPEQRSGAPELRATHMTFVGSRGESAELVLESAFATFQPDRDLARLDDVHAVFTDDERGESFKLTCDHADLNIDTNDFRAEGDVRGETADGQRYSAPWVQYDHEKGLLHTSAPVSMVDATGSYRGDGFRYDVRERRFRLLGNVSVEQNP